MKKKMMIRFFNPENGESMFFRNAGIDRRATGVNCQALTTPNFR
ncbi:hypothetical protein L798_14091 [Zootermopsis nevadensis]|uniref:Uncharacterized protein n=1 Tax=Zootermopsis nevadensis TaxID=136037 RepID=A0A067QRG5_ZOONE|nr:hypothetical protein L798_14091 [Zootermopsis nevadensis]